MADEPDVYSYLATSKVSEVTVAQLEQSLENSFINKRNIESWKGPITVHRLLEVSRTYPWGLPVPEAGAAQSQAVDAGVAVSFLPAGTEEWKIMALSITAAGGTPNVQVYLTDGVTNVLMLKQPASTTESNFMPLETPFIITASLYLVILNTDVSNAISANIAYHKVSL